MTLVHTGHVHGPDDAARPHAAGPTVGEAMLRHPTVHPATLSVGEARAVFAEHPKTHLLLLLDGTTLVSTLTRDDLEGADHDDVPAARLGSLEHRTVSPDVLLAPTREEMVGTGQRRVAVVGPGMKLLGLLCLKRRLTDFCTDEGVASMRRERAREDGSSSTPASHQRDKNN